MSRASGRRLSSRGSEHATPATTEQRCRFRVRGALLHVLCVEQGAVTTSAWDEQEGDHARADDGTDARRCGRIRRIVLGASSFDGRYRVNDDLGRSGPKGHEGRPGNVLPYIPAGTRGTEVKDCAELRAESGEPIPDAQRLECRHQIVVANNRLMRVEHSTSEWAIDRRQGKP